MFTIIRNNALARVGIDRITETDLVLCADGRFYPAQSVSSLRYFFSHAREAQQSAAVGESNGWWGFLVILGLAFLVFRDFHDPAPKARVRFRARNDEPLSASLRARVRERDGSVCAYCRRHAPDGHVDHRVSRVNGGGNHMNNLSWACASCNCSKGARNARQFMRLV
ncbi:MAG: HNH endonuclease [Pyrinomonadaceae bacterium]